MLCSHSRRSNPLDSTQASLSLLDDGPMLSMQKAKIGKLVMKLVGEAPAIDLRDINDGNGISLAIDEAGPLISLDSKGRQSRASIRLGANGGAELTLADEQRRVTTRISVDKDGNHQVRKFGPNE